MGNFKFSLNFPFLVLVHLVSRFLAKFFLFERFREVGYDDDGDDGRSKMAHLRLVSVDLFVDADISFVNPLVNGVFHRGQ